MPSTQHMKRDKKRVKLNKKKIQKAKLAYHSSSESEDSDYEQKKTFTSQFKTGSEKSVAQSVQEAKNSVKRKRKARDEFEEGDQISSGDDEDLIEEEGLSVLEEDDDHLSVSSNDDGEEQGADVKPKVTAAQKMMFAIQKSLGREENDEQKKKQPILSKKKDVEHELDDLKLEAKAKKVLTEEKKKKEQVGRVIPDHSTADYERQLRKVGTKGVVQLFNAIREAQKTTDAVAGDSIQKHKQEVPSISKEVFLKSLKSEPSKPIKTGASVSSKSTKNSTETQDGPAWVQNDFAMSAPKHWDEEDDEDLPELH